MLTRLESDKDTIYSLKKYILDLEAENSSLKEKIKHLKKSIKIQEDEEDLYAVYGGD